MTPLFFYVVIAAYMAFVLASAWQFSRRPEPGRTMRGINLTLVPLGVLVALVGVLAASFNAFTGTEGTPNNNWAIVMVALGLGGASLLLAIEGFILRGRVHSSTEDRRAIVEGSQSEPDRDHGAPGRAGRPLFRPGASDRLRGG